MNPVDWSRAPEGATHVIPSTNKWYRDGGTLLVWGWAAEGWVRSMFTNIEELPSDFKVIARPTGHGETE